MSASGAALASASPQKSSEKSTACAASSSSDPLLLPLPERKLSPSLLSTSLELSVSSSLPPSSEPRRVLLMLNQSDASEPARAVLIAEPMPTDAA